LAVSGSTTQVKTLLIVFHSFTDGTRQIAEAAFRGAASEASLHVRLLRAPDAGAADIRKHAVNTAG